MTDTQSNIDELLRKEVFVLLQVHKASLKTVASKSFFYMCSLVTSGTLTAENV